MGLVLALHYGGHGTPYYGELMLSELIFPSLNGLSAIMVAPDCPSKVWTTFESESYILSLLSYLKDQYKIDSQKILITGYSMGGIGAWFFANRYPDDFSAALIMAAKLPDTISLNDWEVPLYVIHGREDEVYPIVDTTRIVVQMENQGKDVTYRILEQVHHFDVSKFILPLQESVSWVLEHW
jgi:predicted peptidase